MEEAHSSPELLPEILFCNILPRLPAKSVLRFKSVSMQWHSSLTTPSFEKLHLHHSTNDRHQNLHKLIALSTKTPSVFRTIDCEAPEDGLTASRPLPFNASCKYMKILTSFDGLVCVGLTMDWYEYSDLILWNPLTGDYKTMSRINSHKECYKVLGIFGLYYSSCDDDYKLLRVTDDADAYIYSLKFDSWRNIDKISNIFSSWCSTSTQVLNEKIYFLKNGDRAIVRSLHDSIVMFYTKTEKFKKISSPCYGNLNLTVLKGRIHLYVHGSDYIELWRMDGDGDRDGDWKKVGTYLIPHLSSNIYYIDQPLHLMRYGELLAYCTRGKGFLCKVPLTSPIYTEIISWSYIPGHCFSISPSGKYIETLVSPNRY